MNIVLSYFLSLLLFALMWYGIDKLKKHRKRKQRKANLEDAIEALKMSGHSPETIYLNHEEFEKLAKALENPRKPNKALKEAFRKHKEKYGDNE